MGTQRDFGHLRNHAAHGKTVRTDREILVSQDVFQLYAVNDRKGPFQQRFGDLEADEVVILLRGVAILGHLYHVESELGLQMGGVILRVSDRIAVLGSELGILDGNGLVDGRMAGNIGGVVRESAQRKGVLIGVLALQQQFTHEIPAANVVDQIAEFHAAKRIVAEVLYDGATIG